MNPDPIVTEVREARHRISERFGHDTDRLGQHYKELDAELQQSGEYRFVTGFFATDAEPLAASAKH